jgi:hypothetical protein
MCGRGIDSSRQVKVSSIPQNMSLLPQLEGNAGAGAGNRFLMLLGGRVAGLTLSTGAVLFSDVLRGVRCGSVFGI